MIGRWFERTGKRDQVFLATKFGFVQGKEVFEFNSSYEYCKKACARSLQLLRTDYIDLYYLHHPNPNTPIEETMRALAELKEEGKIKYIGLSGIGAGALRRAVKIAPVAAVQTEYSPFMRHIESELGTNLLATCRELGVAVVAYSPLGRGLLTSTFHHGQAMSDTQDLRGSVMPRFMDANLQQNLQIVREFTKLADKKDCSISQLALAWLLKQGDDIIPIPGTKKLKYIEENLGALEVKLSNEEEAEIRHFVETYQLAGSHLPAQYTEQGFINTKEEA